MSVLGITSNEEAKVEAEKESARRRRRSRKGKSAGKSLYILNL